MPKVALYNMSGQQTGEIDLNDWVFGCEVNAAVLGLVAHAIRQTHLHQKVPRALFSVGDRRINHGKHDVLQRTGTGQ